jgi:DNA-binding HxlR family transcriptional regulator
VRNRQVDERVRNKRAKRVRRPSVEQAAKHAAEHAPGESMAAPRPPISIYCEYYQAVIELIGRRWMGAILRALISGGPRRFNELLAAIPDLSDRLLTERLRELTEHGIVERVPAPDISPIAIQYRLTKSGRDLEVVVRAISAWARRWRGGP